MKRTLSKRKVEKNPLAANYQTDLCFHMHKTCVTVTSDARTLPCIFNTRDVLPMF
jgi:hypothetical protein